jgi:hypothetical protein
MVPDGQNWSEGDRWASRWHCGGGDQPLSCVAAAWFRNALDWSGQSHRDYFSSFLDLMIRMHGWAASLSVAPRRD